MGPRGLAGPQDVFDGEYAEVAEEGFGRTQRRVVVSGHEQALAVVSRGNYEALRFRRGPDVVTAVARPGFPVFRRSRLSTIWNPFRRVQAFRTRVATILGNVRRMIQAWPFLPYPRLSPDLKPVPA